MHHQQPCLPPQRDLRIRGRRSGELDGAQAVLQRFGDSTLRRDGQEIRPLLISESTDVGR